jgi:hypothetical protein
MRFHGMSIGWSTYQWRVLPRLRLKEQGLAFSVSWLGFFVFVKAY